MLYTVALRKKQEKIYRIKGCANLNCQMIHVPHKFFFQKILDRTAGRDYVTKIDPIDIKLFGSLKEQFHPQYNNLDSMPKSLEEPLPNYLDSLPKYLEEGKNKFGLILFFNKA